MNAAAVGDLGVAWLRIGLFGFGGGPSVLPLIRHECVERYGWLSEEELLDAIVFGNSLPGPIAVKLAAYIGLNTGGWVGCAVALLALNVPSVAMMLGLGAVYLRWKDAPVVAGMMRGVRPVVVAMLAWTAWSLAPEGVRDWRGALLAVGAFVALAFDVHPAILVAVGLVGGALLLS